MNLIWGKKQDRIIFLLFLISGFCSIVYQLVWVRLAFAAFGVITPVLSVVLSVFMLGLALGSWLGGQYIERLTRQTGCLPILFYALAELLIGIGGLWVPGLLRTGQAVLLSAGNFNSFWYLLFSALILSAALLPWCFCMGTTIPFMLAFIKRFKKEHATGFGFLYKANVIGALCGTVFTAFFLIEWLGLSQTLKVAAMMNFIIAISGVLLDVQFLRREAVLVSPRVLGTKVQDVPETTNSGLVLSMLLTTGFVSMAMEVVWVRAFTPVLLTSIYSFACILAVYLLATWTGSHIYYRHAGNHKAVKTSSLIMLAAYSCFFPILLNDPRTLSWIPGAMTKVIIVLASIFPFCATLGYLAPKLIDEFSFGEPQDAGKAYAFNALGCILGPLFAGYFLLPALGVRLSLAVLAVPFSAYLLYFYFKKAWKPIYVHIVSVALSLVFLYVGSVGVLLSYEDGALYKHGEVRRDYVASVISYGQGVDKKLLVNGIGVAALSPITKFMAHLPLAVHRTPPDSALIICFGVGATFRSAAFWGIRATAVELVPSVRDAFGFYFADAKEILKNPKVQVVVDDGRRFLSRTLEKFDVITLDPPPPVYASGTALLYSEELYRLIKLRLKEGGILQQWYPGEGRDEVSAVARSISRAFPYVRIFPSIEGWGYHFIASMQPFEMPSAEAFEKKLPPKARADLIEGFNHLSVQQYYQIVMSREVPLESILIPNSGISITDDRPYNEYFLMRTLFPTSKKR